jgi:hypothetical protein
MKRSKPEASIQREIEAEIGAEPDLLLFKNSVGLARYVTDDGKEFRVPYGLGIGSPDLVGILAPFGRWLCLEIKVPGEVAEPHQEKSHAVWRKFGAFIRTVSSPAEARAALDEARLVATPSGRHLGAGGLRSESLGAPVPGDGKRETIDQEEQRHREGEGEHDLHHREMTPERTQDREDGAQHRPEMQSHDQGAARVGRNGLRGPQVEKRPPPPVHVRHPIQETLEHPRSLRAPVKGEHR